MKLAAAILALALAGCTNHTAAIAHSAIDARQALGAAIVHMDAAREELDGLQASIDAVQEHVAFVSDEEPGIYSTLKFVSVAGVVIGAFALVYTIKNWKLV
jgi:phosphoenolpyruvate-protein kinase (PTS system EI component)